MYIKTTAVGYVGKDSAVNQNGNVNVLIFSLAVTNESYIDKETEERVNKTLWLNCRLYSTNAEYINKMSEYVKKGSKLFIEAVPDEYHYTDQHGIPKMATVYKVKEIKFLG